MGFERATIQFLLGAKKLGVSFEHVLTIGRQGLHISAAELFDLLEPAGLAKDLAECQGILEAEKGFCEPFLRLLGAQRIDSMDVSTYEAATILHDMNQPLPEALRGRFSLVIDGGSLEHVFNYPTALRNCMEATAANGHFVTITPANNLLGHGFYQISPELLYRALGKENGYRMEKMLLFEHPCHSEWYEVRDPEQVRMRVELVNTKPAYLIACARRTAVVPIFAQPPQQSDYSAIWQENQGSTVTVADMSTKPPRSWRKLVPPEAIRLFRLWQPFRSRWYQRLSIR